MRKSISTSSIMDSPILSVASRTFRWALPPVCFYRVSDHRIVPVAHETDHESRLTWGPRHYEMPSVRFDWICSVPEREGILCRVGFGSRAESLIHTVSQPRSLRFRLFFDSLAGIDDNIVLCPYLLQGDWQGWCGSSQDLRVSRRSK